MLHPHTQLRFVNNTVGYGVFATELIPKGTITWALDPFDQVLAVELPGTVAQAFGESVNHFTWLTARGERILCWDFGKFMNHSCEANSLGPGGCEFEIAVRDIHPGEQLTSDYGTLNLEEPLSCECGARSCRGTISPADLETIAPSCDLALQGALPSVLLVDQPLWRWIEHRSHGLRAMAGDPDSIPSVALHRWHGLHPDPAPRSLYSQ